MWIVVFHSIPALVWCISIATVARVLGMGRRGTMVVSAVLAAAFGKFAFFALVGGNGFNPDLPAVAIWLYSWVYASAMMLAAFASAAYVCDGVLLLFGCRASLRSRRVRTVAAAVMAVLLSAWGVYEGVCVPRVRRVEIQFDSLPREFDGYRIVQLSDLHCSTAARRWRFEGIVQRVNSLAPDMVAITGDFADGRVDDRLADIAPLAQIKARDGVFGCTGNHEAYWEWDVWRAALCDMGIVFPETGQARVIRRGDASLAVGGLQDPAFRGDACPDARNAFSSAPRDAFRILLFHRPCTAANGAESADVRLQLSGHTHGGAMPGLSLLVARVNENRTRGLYRFASDRWLYLSPGSGQWAGFPLRLFNPSEITEITLRKKGT